MSAQARPSDFFRQIVQKLQTELSGTLSADRITAAVDGMPTPASFPILLVLPGEVACNADMRGHGHSDVTFRVRAVVQIVKDFGGAGYYSLTGAESPSYLAEEAMYALTSFTPAAGLTPIRFRRMSRPMKLSPSQYAVEVEFAAQINVRVLNG